MIKNHTHNNDSGCILYIFKKLKDLDNIKESFAFIPLFFKSYTFPYKLCNVCVYDKVIFYFLFDSFKIKWSYYIFFCICNI